MARIGFWQLLLDPQLSYWEAQRINEASDAADWAQAAADGASARASSLEARVAMLGREVVMLRTAMTMLVQTLKDTKVVDERLLDARLEAAMEEASAPTEPAVTAAASDAPRMLTCLRCRKQVPASTTIMTGDGPVCDRCPP